MTDRQLYRIDDVLIRCGWIVLVVAVPMALGLAAPAGPPGWLALPLLLAPVVMLLAGYRVRRREARIVAVWRLLEHSLEVEVPSLLRASSFTRDELHAAIRTLNDRGVAYYVWDDAGDVIRDGRLDAVKVAESAECARCGAAVTVDLRLGDMPACPYCRAPVGAGAADRLRREALERLRPAPAAGAGGAASAPAARPSPRRMSLPVFLLLLVFCWPAAVGYAIYHAR